MILVGGWIVEIGKDEGSKNPSDMLTKSDMLNVKDWTQHNQRKA